MLTLWGLLSPRNILYGSRKMKMKLYFGMKNTFGLNGMRKMQVAQGCYFCEMKSKSHYTW